MVTPPSVGSGSARRASSRSTASATRPSRVAPSERATWPSATAWAIGLRVALFRVAGDVEAWAFSRVDCVVEVARARKNGARERSPPADRQRAANRRRVPR
jgi:hypothetical protein